MLLTDKQCRHFQPKTKPYKKTDGQGLYLQVMPNGGKYWRMNYRFDGKCKTLSFGTYPDVSLKDARLKRDEARVLISDGLDPSFEKKRVKLKNSMSADHRFRTIGEEWIENRKEAISQGTLTQISNVMERDVFPLLGEHGINQITAPELLAVLRNIEERGAFETARKARNWCSQIFRYAIATGRAERDIAIDLRGALKPRKSKHRAYLKEDELAEFFKRLRAYDGDDLTRLALDFVVLTFVRTKELRGALWSEINFEKAEWRIPAERMKMERPHIVPLSMQAISVLKAIQPISGHGDLIFPIAHNPKKQMSENTMLYAMYRMGYHGRATVHGFRATASTILNEHGYSPDVIERQLAHVEGNQVRAAYNHAQYLPERRNMMQWWAAHLDALKS